jgi:hypothetical protein
MTRRPSGEEAALALETADTQTRMRKILPRDRAKVVIISSVARMMSSMSTTYPAVLATHALSASMNHVSIRCSN